MTASNPELMRSLEQRIANDKAAHLRGWARIHLSHLEFPDPIREEDKKIAAELSRHIAAEGCHDEKYPIAAIIDDDILQAALRQAGIAADSIGKASLSNPPKLKLSKDTKLACLGGLHRKLAARQVLPPIERWTVELYDKGLGSDARQNLKDGYSYSANYTDGEIFRHIRECQLAGDKVGEGRWKARYSPTKVRDFKQLLKRPILLNALDSVRPVRGLWGGFHAGSLHILLTPRCDEEIAHYIKGIEKLFTRVFNSDTSLMELTDNFTIEEIQLRAPALSSYDAEYIQSQMTSKSKRFFPNIGDPFVRAGITSHLLATEHTIPTISTLFKDLRYLQPAVKMIRGLVPRTVDSTLREALSSHFPRESAEDSLDIQVSERSYITYSGSSGELFDLAVRQLFLYAIRRSAKPLGQRADIYSIFELAEFASRLGFFSDEITLTLEDDPYQNVVLDLLYRILPTVKATDTQMRTQPVIRELRELVDTLSTTAVQPLAPWVTVPGLGEPISRRSGVAVWVPPSDGMGSESDLDQMFLRQMDLPLSSLQRGGEGISSFYVKRSIYLRFFGVSALDGHSSPHLRNNLGGQPSHISLPSPHPAEQAMAPEPALGTRESNPTENSREHNTNQDLRTMGRKIIFIEHDVPIREVPFEKDRVNFQAREYADQGKKLHVPEGAHFVWEYCFDILSRTGSSTVIVSTINHPKNGKRPHYQGMPGQFPPSSPAGDEGNRS